VTAAWIALVLIGVGLPLGAWWVGGRPLWARSDQRARRAQEAHREWIARHGLSSSEVAEVQRVIVRGGVFEDARLRAAAVEEARTQLTVWGGRSDVVQRVRWVLAALWGVLVVLFVIASVVTGDSSWHFLLLVVNFTAVVVPQVLLRRNLRRAITLNGGSAP
jgi:Flp pilus assembly protein TadB